MVAEWSGTVGHHSALIGAAWRCAGMRVWFYYFPCGFTTAKGSERSIGDLPDPRLSRERAARRQRRAEELPR